MVDWEAFTLFLFIVVRMSGFVLFNPLFGRNGIPALFKMGFIMMLSAAVYTTYGGSVAVPNSLIEFAVRVLLELGVGLVISLVMRFFLFIPEQAGEIIDTQMGMSMARSYDPGSQINSTSTASLLRIMMIMLFFAANGHMTLLRIMATSGTIVPYGKAVFGERLANKAVELFAECVLLAVKMSFPILAAELMGQVGMGVLMKVIPQINVFAINIELKVIVGFVMLLMLLAPISDFMLEIENAMLRQLQQTLQLLR